LFPQRRCAVRFRRMNQEERRLIDHHILVCFVNDLELQWWSNGVADDGEFKQPLLHHSNIPNAPPSLTFRLKTALS
jgi:hypothetical protein